MIFHFSEIADTVPFLIQGVGVTLKYTLISLFFGSILGTILGILKTLNIKGVGLLADFYTSIFRGTPLLVQLTLIYFAMPQLIQYQITAFEAGVLAFSLNSAAYISEIIRGGIQSVDPGQSEALMALGVAKNRGMKDVILPQALRSIMPSLVNEMVDLLKESCLISIIGEMDLLRRATIVASQKYLFFEPLLVVALVYYVLVALFSHFAKVLEKRMHYA